MSLRGEELRKELQKKYRDHRTTDYSSARKNLYNDVDCYKDQIYRLYADTTYPSPCHIIKDIPHATNELLPANAEHVVPQSLFSKKTPFVSDLHHLFSAGHQENENRKSYMFGEFDPKTASIWCRDNACTTKLPENPEQYSCLSSTKPFLWMPIAKDRGTVARAVLYFQTVYPEINISSVNNVSLYLKWNREFPPTERDKYRNEMVNITQGNRNPYVDNPILADWVFDPQYR
ncbi:secreted nuclease, putative [Trichomonas vaginalis G3]|uniref:Secreted nuclease, putative n=1 Tax=Trichomonas vaginalis (strain ATCC PRA-98 / G3) TaxID=412133 RepID=A2DT31_TRIV3|nr:endonuclease I family [Trichomonas vaginalis G3]EAY16438.1 secreted nuclease, putative [Trichomonas vaginalis G3]KAI5505696.1 endonuclease I family [Trichomonas vaginalis G3]|eukprot:XP_001328661.1 secreted nuclease [Trichomonas vaginalis G3]